MTTKLLTELAPSNIPARLLRYQDPSGDDFETAVTYLWNVALAEALFCSFNAVEIALRNALHTTLTNHFGVPNWYDRQGLLEREQRKNVEVVKQRIQTHGNSLTPDRVVSELTFGFWVVILSRNYNARRWQG